MFCLANWIISTNKTSVNAATRLVFRILPIIRSSRPEVFCEKGVLRNFAKFTGKHAAPATLLKKRLCHRCFPVNFVKFLRTPFFYRTPLVAASESSNTAWKVSKYGLISGPYFPVFGLNSGKYGPEETPYLGTFYAVYNTYSKHMKEIFEVYLESCQTHRRRNTFSKIVYSFFE